MSDLIPQSKWKARRARFLSWWSRTQFKRAKATSAFVSTARLLLTLAISVVGGTLVAYGVWSIFEPVGYMVAGLLLWGIQWNYGNEEGRR